MIFYGKQTIDKDDIDAVINSLQSDFLTTGPKVVEFESAIAKYCDASYCVAVSNGTAALHLAALALLNPGDKVLTTPNSFLATSNSILYANATPIFVDITSDGSIDLDICEHYLQNDPSIKAIFAVSFSGKILDQNKLYKLQTKYNIKILEDNAHTMGVKLLHSDISVFSFHPVKHITTAEGGAVVTNDKRLYDKIKSLRNHGQDQNHNMNMLGFNYRLNDILSALGISQLNKLDKFILARQKIAKNYHKYFDKHDIINPLYEYSNYSYYHLFVLLINFDKLTISKEQFINILKEQQIGLQIHYKPINKQPYYKKIGYGNEKTPIMDNYIKQCCSLPIYPTLSDTQQQYVIDMILNTISKYKA